jgi:hypothetical protein
VLLPRASLDCDPPTFTSCEAGIKMHTTMHGLFIKMVSYFLLGLASNCDRPNLCLQQVGLQACATTTSLLMTFLVYFKIILLPFTVTCHLTMGTQSEKSIIR